MLDWVLELQAMSEFVHEHGGIAFASKREDVLRQAKLANCTNLKKLLASENVVIKQQVTRQVELFVSTRDGVVKEAEAVFLKLHKDGGGSQRRVSGVTGGVGPTNLCECVCWLVYITLLTLVCCLA